jgi:Family of unknown function (DUF5959)
VTKQDLPDLIHLADDLGNSVVLRLTEQGSGGLTGEIEVRSYFVSGRKETWLLVPEDLDGWETVLDDLARGDNTAWREGQRATEIWIEREDDSDRLIVSVADRMSSLVTVELMIEVADDWLEDHRERLRTIRKMQPERQSG